MLASYFSNGRSHLQSNPPNIGDFNFMYTQQRCVYKGNFGICVQVVLFLAILRAVAKEDDTLSLYVSFSPGQE